MNDQKKIDSTVSTLCWRRKHKDDKYIFGYAEFEVLIIHLFGNIL